MVPAADPIQDGLGFAIRQSNQDSGIARPLASFSDAQPGIQAGRRRAGVSLPGHQAGTNCDRFDKVFS